MDTCGNKYGNYPYEECDYGCMAGECLSPPPVPTTSTTTTTLPGQTCCRKLFSINSYYWSTTNNCNFGDSKVLPGSNEYLQHCSGTTTTTLPGVTTTTTTGNEILVSGIKKSDLKTLPVSSISSHSCFEEKLVFLSNLGIGDKYYLCEDDSQCIGLDILKAQGAITSSRVNAILTDINGGGPFGLFESGITSVLANKADESEAGICIIEEPPFNLLDWINNNILGGTADQTTVIIVAVIMFIAAFVLLGMLLNPKKQ
jgi:hypothetical protein